MQDEDDWECGGEVSEEAVAQAVRAGWQVGDATRHGDAAALEAYGALLLDGMQVQGLTCMSRCQLSEGVRETSRGRAVELAMQADAWSCRRCRLWQMTSGGAGARPPAKRTRTGAWLNVSGCSAASRC